MACCTQAETVFYITFLISVVQDYISGLFFVFFPKNGFLVFLHLFQEFRIQFCITKSFKYIFYITKHCQNASTHLT